MKQITLLFVAFSLLLSSCSKDYNSLPPDSKYLVGNSSNFYMPLAVDNSWTYTNAWVIKINSKVNTTYAMTDNGVPNNIWIDSTGAYIVKYYDDPLLTVGIRTNFSGSVPFVYIPANPVTGQTWTGTIMTGMTLTTQVVNANASIATSLGVYTNCLEMSYTYNYVDNNNMAGSVTWLKYFKKGVGQVYAMNNVNDAPASSYFLRDFVLN